MLIMFLWLITLVMFSLHDEEDSLVAVTSGRLRARKELENYLGEKVEACLKIVGNGNVWLACLLRLLLIQRP